MQLSRAGHDHLLGHQLLRTLTSACDEEPLVGHMIWPDEDADRSPMEDFPDDLIEEQWARDYRPDAIFIEGGLFGAEGRWRAPRGFLESVVDQGGVVVVADADKNDFRDNKEHYELARDFLRAQRDEDSLYTNITHDDLLVGADPERCLQSPSQMVCLPEQMLVADWLKPIYEGVDKIVATLAISLLPGGDILASGNRDTTGVLQGDMWVRKPDPCPFAHVRQLGDGFVVFISASVSGDYWVQQGSQNDLWLSRTIAFLLEQARGESKRRAPLRRLRDAVARARGEAQYLEGDAAGDVFARAVEPDLDREVGLRASSSDANDVRQHAATAFGDTWTLLSARSQDYIVTAELVRGELTRHAARDSSIDFAAAVVAYSRALEFELAERLFLEFRESGVTTLPDDTGNEQIDRSLRDLRRFSAGGRPPTLATMAHCLRNVGAKLAHADRNDFAAFLQRRLRDRDWFLDWFPSRVNSYVDKYRNAAAHIDSLSQEECDAARALLVDEPPRLLAALVEALAPHEPPSDLGSGHRPSSSRAR